MSSSIEIKAGEFAELSIEVGASFVEIEIAGVPKGEWSDNTALIGVLFNMKDKEDRKAIKNLISHLQHQLQVHETPPYSTCPSCSWLKRERGIEACEEHSKLMHGQVRPSVGQKIKDLQTKVKEND